MGEPLLSSTPFQGSQPARLWLGTYDLNGTMVGERDVAQLSKWFLAQKTREYDVVAVSLQGVRAPRRTSRAYSGPLEAVVKKCLNLVAEDTSSEYSLLSSCQESGTHLMVFVNSSIPFRITEVEAATVVLRRSTFSEKRGAVGIRAAFNKTTVCFVTTKFTGGFADYDERNREYATIAKGLQFATNLRGIDDHDAVFWAGNFNYRIGLGWDVVMDRIKRAEDEGSEELQVLYDNDQMVVQMRAGLAFSYYTEAVVRFAPTSTFQVGSDAYQTESIPAWTGRILWKPLKVKQVAYDSVEEVRISDQRPVYAAFELEVSPQEKILNRKPIPQTEKQVQLRVEETALGKDDLTLRSPQPPAPKSSVPTVPLEESIRVETWSRDRNLQLTHELLHEMRDGKYWQTKKHRRRVRVAILDSGIDMAHPEIATRSERIVDTFCPIPGLEDQGNQDKGGHGTHIALLLLQIAPMVDLYIARVFEDAKGITDDYVGGAILHGVNEWQVDVILMSFGFKFWVPSISHAIRVAAFNDVLMFAAASNEGANADIDLAYPARETNVLDIRATDHLGNGYMYNPPWDAGARWTFATLGEKVLSAWTEGQMLPKSGTSMAAAIAAGTAVLLLDFSRLPALKGQAPRHLEHVASFDGMRLLLEACSSRTPDNLLYIKPWLVFSKKGFDRGRIANYIDDVLDEHFG